MMYTVLKSPPELSSSREHEGVDRQLVMSEYAGGGSGGSQLAYIIMINEYDKEQFDQFDTSSQKELEESLHMLGYTVFWCSPRKPSPSPSSAAAPDPACSSGQASCTDSSKTPDTTHSTRTASDAPSDAKQTQAHAERFTRDDLFDLLGRFTLAQFPPDLTRLMLIFSGHGDAHGVLSSDGERIPYDLFEHVIGTNRWLESKLKIIIYACCTGVSACYSDVDEPARVLNSTLLSYSHIYIHESSLFFQGLERVKRDSSTHLSFYART